MTEKLIHLIDEPVINASDGLDEEYDRRYFGLAGVLLRDQKIVEIAKLIDEHSLKFALNLLIFSEEDPSGVTKICNKPISNDILHQLDALVEQHLDEIQQFL